MTEIQFHFNVPDRLAYACRLVRKALPRVKGIAISGPMATLSRIDRDLWSFDPQAFIPHMLMTPDQAVSPRSRATPVWLVERAFDAAHLPVLVHLGEEPAEGFESFERLIEVVSVDEAQRQSARRRWRHYAGRGFPIVKHDVIDVPEVDS